MEDVAHRLNNYNHNRNAVIWRYVDNGYPEDL